MIITQTKISKNIRIQKHNLIAKELEVERNMDDNTMQFIIIGNASENEVKCIRESHRVPSLSWHCAQQTSRAVMKMQAVYALNCRPQ